MNIGQNLNRVKKWRQIYALNETEKKVIIVFWPEERQALGFEDFVVSRFFTSEILPGARQYITGTYRNSYRKRIRKAPRIGRRNFLIYVFFEMVEIIRKNLYRFIF